MVHALEEIRRVLMTGCILVDIRPLADRWPVEISVGDNLIETGRLTDLPKGVGDDLAANAAVEEAARRGWFVREQDYLFPFYQYWDDPDEMIAHISGQWSDFMLLKDDVQNATHNAWNAADIGRRLRVKLTIQLTIWRKQ